MPRPFKKKTFRDKLEAQISDLVEQTDDLRKQVIEKAPGVRDQIVEQASDLRQQVVDKAPGVRDQIVAALPDKEQLLDLRDDLFEKLPEGVQDKLPEGAKPKPKRKRLRKVAAVGVLTGAGAAAFAILKRNGAHRDTYEPPVVPDQAQPEPTPTPETAGAVPAQEGVVPPVDAVDQAEPAADVKPTGKKS